MKKLIIIALAIVSLAACTPVGMAVKGTTTVVSGAASAASTAANVVF